MTRVYDEIVNFIAGGSSPEEVVSFQPSQEVREHVAELLARESCSGLSSEDAADLNHYLKLEDHATGKARARQNTRA